MANPMPGARPSLAVTAVERSGLLKWGHHDGRFIPADLSARGLTSSSDVAGTIHLLAGQRAPVGPWVVDRIAVHTASQRGRPSPLSPGVHPSWPPCSPR